MYLLAHGYRSHGRGRLKIRAIYTMSETLFDCQRAAMQEAFGCPVFDWYANSEMCGNIVECEAGRRHLKLEHSRVEILDAEDRPVLPGGTGRLVCTGFGNAAFPLVRYDIGDIVRVARDQHCACGRSGVLIDEIIGRVRDYLVTADGTLVCHLDSLFQHSANVLEAQVVQREAGRITIRLVKTEAYSSSDERAIRQEAAVRLGSDTAVEFEYVQTIPRTSSGKFQFVDSSLDQRELLARAAAC
jgi:phenylacetate-CoA ligase